MSAPPAAKTKRPPGKPAGQARVKSPMVKAMEKLGLRRDIDLALHLPLRYEDETRITPLTQARDGAVIQFEAAVSSCEVSFRPRRQLVVVVRDGAETCTLRFFNFYPSMQKAMAPGSRIRVRGEVRGGFLGWTMVHPAVAAAGAPLPDALTPIYPASAGLPQAYLRKAIAGALERVDLSETVAPQLLPRPQHGQPVWTLRAALQFLHHPASDVSLSTLEDHSHPAWQRLKAEELLAQQLSQLEARRARALLRAPRLRPVPGGLRDRLSAALPFDLTDAQRRVGREIADDLGRSAPMHRLLQGDVGSGKTVVAALAAAICIDGGYQCALMAPTEILAEQHFRKLIGWLEPLGVTTAWLTGSQKARERRAMLALIASGEAALVIGTHAVIQDKVVFHKLALAIIDEQHRFGVAQRLALRGKMQPQPTGLADPAEAAASDGVADDATNDATNGHADAANSAGTAGATAATPPRTGSDSAVLEPHLLMMSATPIPRTLAMGYYADLDVSTIDSLPPGRTPIVTRLVNAARRDEVISRIRDQLAQGRQVYWVCPLIEESEALDLANATETQAGLRAALAGTEGGTVEIGLLHSRMPVAEKKAVMDRFAGGHMGVLVSTTVIEVGVDVPNASLMVVEHAERFGLSQLHQLRGRVGRGAAASACVLMYSTGDAPRLGETARARLRAMIETTDGFEIARRDLDIRGPGEFLGARQSGAALLRFADLDADAPLLQWARDAASRMWERHPELARRHVMRWLGGKAEFLKA
jgi:ATP-dependent DNA helicase RecG